MNDEELSMTEPRKNKYELVGGNAVHTNPFGADPGNHTAGEKHTEWNEAISSSMQVEKAVSSFREENPEDMHGTPVEDARIVDTPKRFRLNPILVVAVISLLALGTCWMMGVFRKKANPVDGTYRFTHVDVHGEKVLPEQLAAYGVNTKNTTIEIDGDKADLTVFGFTGHCDFTMVGDEFTITNGSKQMSGKADIANDTVRLQHNGSDLVFVKQ